MNLSLTQQNKSILHTSDISQLLNISLANDKNYAVRIKGKMNQIVVRSFPKQISPYKGLNKIVQTQSILDTLYEINGTCIGYFTNRNNNNLNFPGLHLHFISDNRRFGGHVIDLDLKNLNLEYQELKDSVRIIN
ncbi:MAG: hypothetical protein RIR51_14 [Bacteroidota bacterium]|jgi:acetolactate decarboxylase